MSEQCPKAAQQSEQPESTDAGDALSFRSRTLLPSAFGTDQQTDEKRQPEPLQKFHPGNVELISLRFKKIREG